MLNDKLIGCIENGGYKITVDGTWAVGVPEFSGGKYDGIYSDGDNAFIVCLDKIKANDIADYITVLENNRYDKVSCTRFCEMLEAAAKSCESAVDIVDAKIPARIIPAVNAGITPNLLKNFEISTMIVSAAEALSYVGTIPSFIRP